ncbi:MAG: efflux RND transporter periplasmic adaptor subunit [Cyanobacteria bacterium J06597_1]
MTLQTSTPEPSLPQQLELFHRDEAVGRSRPKPVRLSWRKLVAVVPLALLVGGVAICTNAFNPNAEPQESVSIRPLPVETLEVTLSESYETQRTYTGDIEARRTSELGFEQSGLVVRMLVEEGDRVIANQVIAELDTQRLLAQRQELLAQKAQAEADLSELVAGPRFETISSSQANVRDLEAQLELAEQRYQRRQQLLTEGAISTEELDEFISDRNAIQARLDAANSDLEELQTGSRSEDITAQQAVVRSLDARIGTLDVDIAKSQLRAPFDGRVALRHVDEGVVISAGQTVLRLVEDGAMEARVGLPVQAAANLEVGSEQAVFVDGREYSATVKSLLPELNSSTRTISAILSLPDGAIAAPGEVVRVAIVDRVQGRGYWLPATALVRSDRGLWSTYALSSTNTLDPVSSGSEADDFTVQRQQVEVLQTDGDRVFVRGTLQPGDRIVATGTHRIVVGQRVTPTDTELDVVSEPGVVTVRRPNYSQH